MNSHPKDLSKAFLGILVTVLLVVSVFSVGSALASTETEDDGIEILVYKRGIDEETLEAREGYSVIEDYDSFVLVETTEEDKLALESKGYPVESLANQDYVGLHSYSFHVEDGVPEVPEELEIDEYRDDGHGYYILQFRGPIKAEWQEELEERGVLLHEFKHRFNFIVEMNQETREEVERLDFVEWTGIYQPAYRFDRELLERKEPVYLDISLFEGADPALIADGIAETGAEIHHIGEFQVSVEVEPEEIVNLANLKGVQSITEGVEDYHFFNERATWVTQTNEQDNRKVTDEGVTGKGQLLTVMDSELYPDHEAFADPDGDPIGDNHRKIQDYYIPGDADSELGEGVYHGTHVAGTVLGESPPYGEYSNQDGNALEARLLFQDIGADGMELEIPSDMYNDAYGDAYDRGSRMHTNSWGSRGDGEYGELAAESDEFIWDHKDFNILFAAGNDGPEENTLSPQAAGKNVIAVGAAEGGSGGDGTRGGSEILQEQENVASFSSRGYAADGRIKPDILHIGSGVVSADRSETGYDDMDGTSMSCPGIAGHVGQVRDYYERGWYPTGTQTDTDGFNPSNALVRATLINGAVEMSGSGAHENDNRFPNNDQGFGRSKLDRALHFEGDDRNLQVFDSWDEGVELGTGDEWDMSFHVDDPSQELEVTLAWTDPPAQQGADPAIINDLDLELSSPDGTRYVGNAFTGYDPGHSEADPTDNFWSGPRNDEFDGLNVIENILLLPDENDVESGSYELTVTGHQVPEGPQPFAVVVSGGIEAADPPEIEITRPSGGETWDFGDTETIEWDTTEGDAPIDSVDLEYSTDDGDSWDVIDTGIVGDDHDWSVPDEWSDEARIRATVYDDDSMSSSDVSPQFSLRGTEPPSIELTSPTGGEVWMPGEEEEITWDTTEGDATIDSVDLEYSTDDGGSWTTIATGEDDDGSYLWTVPDEPTDEARIRALVHDVDGYTGEDVSGTFTIDSDVEEYDLTINIDGQGTTDPAEGTHSYAEGSEVTVTATADQGWYFEQWTGDHTGTDDEITVIMTEDKQITAHFEESDGYTLTTDTIGEGIIDVDPDKNEYDEGEEVTLTAIPDEGWEFKEWQDDATGTDTTTVITMDDHKTVTAVFEEEDETYELIIDTEGEGTTDPGIGTHNYEKGAEVTIEAIPDEGWEFEMWTGDHGSVEEETTITMNYDKEVTAHFDEIDEEETYDLIIYVEGNGITDPVEGSHTYNEGEEETLTAIAEEGWEFEMWTGDHGSVEEETTITMNYDKEVTAHFDEIDEEETYDLTIDIEGQGSTEPEKGTHTYEVGEEVTVTAEPEEDWYFDQWTGDHEGSEEEITITMDDNKEITAHFDTEEETYDLTINIEGEGTTDPGPGEHTYVEDEEVPVTADPAEDWYFNEWTGDYEGTEEEITITMDENKEITAHFQEDEVGVANFEVEITDYEENVTEGENVTISYRVENTGDARDTQDIVLSLNGEVKRVETIELGPGEIHEGEFTLDAEEVGELEFQVGSDDDTSENVDVNVMSVDPEDDDPEDDDSFVADYWWLIVVLLIGLVAVVVLFLMMQGEEENEELEEENEEMPTFGKSGPESPPQAPEENEESFDRR